MAESLPAIPMPKEQDWPSSKDMTEQPNGSVPPDESMNGDPPRGPSESEAPTSQIPGSKPGTIYREKQIKLVTRTPKANKVYIGGLPEHTRQEDLQACFGKIGSIISIELKLGYGFVEFDAREAAEEAVAEYHEGYFMGNKIKVELSHGGGKTAKFAGEPGACFKCGQQGHWARECPNHVVTVGGHRRGNHDSLLDRISQPGHRDSGLSASAPAQPLRDSRDARDIRIRDARDVPPYRDDRYGGPPDRRPGYDYPPPPPPGRDYPRDYRSSRDPRPPSPPPRDYRDYPGGPPPPRSSRDYDDYRRDHRGAPPPPPSRYDSRVPYYSDYDHPPRDAPGYPARPAYGAPPPLPPRDVPFERPYDKRAGPPPPIDRYAAYPPPVAGVRPRSPGVPPRVGRDEFDRSSRDYPPPPRPEYRGRASPPPAVAPRYSEHAPAPYRRRSQSPPPSRTASNGHYRAGYPGPAPPLGPASDAPVVNYPPSSGPAPSAPYPPQGGYPSQRYASPPPTGGPTSAGPSPGGRVASMNGGLPGRSGRDERDRDYAPRSSRDAGEPNGPPGGSYRGRP